MEPVINKDNINLFWKYIIKRYNIYLKRKNNESYPWTDDPILLKWKFTNVFREDDPGTIYVIDKIIPNFQNDFQNLLFNVIIYRLYNKINTMDYIGLQKIDTFDKQILEVRLRVLSITDKVFTNAFIVSSFAFISRDCDKIGRTCILLEKIRDMIPELSKNILENKDSEFTYNSLLGIPGIGKFLAYQIAVDLGYWNQEIFNEDECVVSGPGCISGIDKLFVDKGELNYEECIQHLCNIQKQGFLDNGYDMNELFKDRKQRYLNLMAMENCLCEISKYLKVYYKKGRARNKYRFTEKISSIF